MTDIVKEEEFFDATPYLKLFINKDGKWFQNEKEIIHAEIYKQFNGMLEKMPDSGYRVRMGREVCKVEVEDAPFVVLTTGMDQNKLLIELNDGSSEIFNPHEFWIGDGNVPYCIIKNGKFHARFSRAAYYQIAKYISLSDDERFYFVIDGERTEVKHQNPLTGG